MCKIHPQLLNDAIEKLIEEQDAHASPPQELPKRPFERIVVPPVEP